MSIGLGQSQAQQQMEVVRQQAAEGSKPASIFRADTNLAIISFAFLPKRHNRLDNLRLEDIEILEDGAPQQAAVLEGSRIVPRTIPTDVILLFDCSPRFKQYLNLKILKPDLLDELENVRISIYGFGDAVYRLVKPTRNFEELKTAMKELAAVPAGSSVGDPIIQTMRAAASVPGSHPRVLIAFSGAADRICQMPRIASNQTIRVARELGIALYPVALQPQSTGDMDASVSGHKTFHQPLQPLPSFAAAKAFLDLGPATGGRSFSRFAMPEEIFPEVFKHVAAQTREEYIAGFYPTASGDPRPHEVQVVLRNKQQGEILGGFRVLVH